MTKSESGSGRSRGRPRWALSWLVVALVMAAIFVGSSIPDDKKPDDPFKYADKVQHFTAYGILGWAVYRAMRAGATGKSKAFHALTAIAIASLYGVTDETHQYFVPGRSTEFLDWTADTIGATAAVAVSHLRRLNGGS